MQLFPDESPTPKLFLIVNHSEDRSKRLPVSPENPAVSPPFLLRTNGQSLRTGACITVSLRTGTCITVSLRTVRASLSHFGLCVHHCLTSDCTCITVSLRTRACLTVSLRTGACITVSLQTGACITVSLRTGTVSLRTGTCITVSRRSSKFGASAAQRRDSVAVFFIVTMSECTQQQQRLTFSTRARCSCCRTHRIRQTSLPATSSYSQK